MNKVLGALGVINETVPQTRVITPYGDGLKAFEAFLASAAVKGAKLRTMIYGCTLNPYFDAIIAAHKAGADVKVIFDHTQAHGHFEKPHFAALDAAGMKDGIDYLIGTSPVQHEIVHLKATIIWTPDGKATVEAGSWNYSISATKELNDLCFTESVDLAAYYEKAFDLLWPWIKTHEQKYQTL